jgi:gliding motility-associated protein GldM
MTGPDGLPKTYSFGGSYTVMAPSATAAADKMNVLYAGIDNPISVNASVALERISIGLSGGSQTKTGSGRYNISVPENLIGQTITITTTATIGDKQQTMGSTVFRVKRVPNPEACLGGTTFKGGRISKAELLANPFVLASMGQDFVYDLQWAVNSYQVTFIIRGIEDPPITCTGRNFSETIKSKISSSPAGTVVYFSDIKASCVAGSRTLNSIAAILR